MFASQREKCTDIRIIALVELDMQKMCVRIVLAREAIRERMLGLENSGNYHPERQSIEGAIF
jgi:hypothetical protein